MLYVIYNELDEQIRLVNADTPENAIAKAKKHVTPEELHARRERSVAHEQRMKEIWTDIHRSDAELAKSFASRGETYTPSANRIDPDTIHPEECWNYTVDDFVWEVRQVIDPSQEIIVIEDAGFY